MRSWEELSKNEQNAIYYSDLYKATYGFRPRNDTSSWDEARWEKEMDDLHASFVIEQARERKAEEASWEKFLDRVNDTMKLIYNCTLTRAVEIIADAEGCDAEERSFYGWESLEYTLGIKFGNIKKWLKAQEI